MADMKKVYDDLIIINLYNNMSLHFMGLMTEVFVDLMKFNC